MAAAMPPVTGMNSTSTDTTQMSAGKKAIWHTRTRAPGILIMSLKACVMQPLGTFMTGWGATNGWG